MEVASNSMPKKRHSSTGRSAISWLKEWARRNPEVAVIWGVYSGVIVVLMSTYTDGKQIAQDVLSPLTGIFWCGPFDWPFLVLTILISTGAIYLAVAMRRVAHGKQMRFAPRFARSVRVAAALFVGVMLCLTVFVALLWFVPPLETVILVADFDDPTDEYGREFFTPNLTSSLETILQPHPEISVRRLFRSISGGPDESEAAERLGRCPLNKASIVIWGNVIREKDNNEAIVHFKIIPNANAAGSSMDQFFGQTDIQSNLPLFASDLGEQLGQLSAFASGVAVMLAGDFRSALPLLDTAYGLVHQPGKVGQETVDGIRFFRSFVAFFLGYIYDAMPDLREIAGPAFNPAIKANPFTDRAIAVLLGFYSEYQPPEANLELASEILAYGRENRNLALQKNALEYLRFAADDLGDQTLYETSKAEAAVLADQLLATPIPMFDYGSSKQLAAPACICDPIGLILEHASLASAAKVDGRYLDAIAELEIANRITEQVGAQAEAALILGDLGDIAREQEQCSLAEEHYQESLRIFQDLGLAYSQGKTFKKLGVNAFECKDYAAARQYMEQALPLLRQEGALYDAAGTEELLGHAYYIAAEYEKAVHSYESANRYWELRGFLSDQAYVLGWLGNAYGNLHQYTDAKALLEKSKALHAQLNEEFPEDFEKMFDYVTFMDSIFKQMSE